MAKSPGAISQKRDPYGFVKCWMKLICKRVNRVQRWLVWVIWLAWLKHSKTKLHRTRRIFPLLYLEGTHHVHEYEWYFKATAQFSSGAKNKIVFTGAHRAWPVNLRFGPFSRFGHRKKWSDFFRNYPAAEKKKQKQFWWHQRKNF